MSMTLILWKAPVVADSDQAARLLEPWYETEDDSAFEPSDAIAKVADELRRRWPYRMLTNEETVERMSKEERAQYLSQALKEIIGVDQPEGSPWADLPFWQSDRLLVLDIRWGADDEVGPVIYALARTCELVVYDPQGPDVFLPTDPTEEVTEFPGFGPVAWLKIGAMVVALSGITYAAWLIPHWIRWPAVVIAGFFTAAAWFVLAAMMFGRRIIESESAPRSTCAGDAPPL